VLDQWGIVYDQPLLLSTRQAGAAIEGAVRQSLTRLERLAVDTHGYTDFGWPSPSSSASIFARGSVPSICATSSRCRASARPATVRYPGALQRQICTQALPSRRGRRAEELIATSAALTLVTNCLMSWNTQRLQRAVDREAARIAPRYAIDALRSIGPVRHRHINFRGTYRFPVERYAERLVQSAA
jgi:hypothetical protein